MVMESVNRSTVPIRASVRTIGAESVAPIPIMISLPIIPSQLPSAKTTIVSDHDISVATRHVCMF